MSADKELIDKELDKYLGEKISWDSHGIFKEPIFQVAFMDHVKVRLLSFPRYNTWIDTAYDIGVCTWDQSLSSLKSAHIDRRKFLAETLLKDRPISAVLESAIFVFEITNVPRSMTHQIVRHRGMAFSQQSFRVSSCYPDSVRCPERMNEKMRNKFEKTVKQCRELYKEMIQSGIPMEQARNIMPMGTETKIIMVTNLKELKGYIKARTGELTQDEHSFIVKRILDEMLYKCPEFHKMVIR